MLWSLALFAFIFASAQGRAVNISNTWVLPEEGFPVFYRYFRDRISWYEADAVCQFHHANLVTVDTTAQYDAVRAYLKELDISSAVWVGLIRSNPDGDFTWTDYRGLSGDGYWSSAPDPRAAPLCAAADPAADYRWEARACGGPTVASFICELPVPQWALGNEGCMVKALPALTVLYLPESAAVQLTADCGLAGVKKVQCTGNVKREDLLKDLSCIEDDEQASTLNTGATSISPLTSSENSFTDQDVTNDITTDYNITTEHEDDINQSSTLKPKEHSNESPTLNKINQIDTKIDKIISNKNVPVISANIDNLQNTFKLIDHDNHISNDVSNKLEDEKLLQHKIIHEEITRHGNDETIFTQATDHFIPPLVMAKAKIGDDMTVLSLEQKHAQQLAEQILAKHLSTTIDHINIETESPLITNQVTQSDTTSLLTTTITPTKLAIEKKVKELKYQVPKKYDMKQFNIKNKNRKSIDIKTSSIEDTTPTAFSLSTGKHLNSFDTTTEKYSHSHSAKEENEPIIDLTVIIKEPTHKNMSLIKNNDLSKIEIIQNETFLNDSEIKSERSDSEIKEEISVKLPTKENNVTFAHEIIKITILKEDNLSHIPAVFEVTTKVPVYEDNTSNPVKYSETVKAEDNVKQRFSTETVTSDIIFSMKPTEITTLHTEATQVFVSITTNSTESAKDDVSNSTYVEHILNTTADFSFSTIPIVENYTETDINFNMNTTNLPELETNIESHEDLDILERNMTDTIDDFQSPLLSGANEPVRRPNRSRRPAQPIRNKFNPFRILG
ncbi:hypothetical protein ACJJTC_011997 [Scirpophaga incertulas]